MFSAALIVLGLFATLQNGDAADFSGWSAPSTVGTKSGSTTAQSVAEGGTVSITFTATGGVTPIAYSINTQTVSGHFAIVGTTGVLSLATGNVLDYETTATYTVEVFAIDSTTGGTFFTATATTVITVTDINDNTPTFSPTTYSATVADGAVAATSVITVTATDADGASPNNVFGYTFLPVSTTFSISSAGVITVSTGQTLARATTPSYTLVAVATDTGTTPGALSSSTTVTVCVGSASQCSSATAITASAITVLFALVLKLN